MLLRLVTHLRSNVVAYVALFTALAGTSYAAVRLAPGSVTSPAIASRAVTHPKLSRDSVTSANVRARSLIASDFAPGVLTTQGGAKGGQGANGSQGAKGAQGAQGAKGDPGPPGPAGGAATVLRAHSTGAVNAAHGATADIPLNNVTWTQTANELNLLAGVMTVKIPSSCSGFGTAGALVLNVDGAPTTTGFVPSTPASQTVSLPFNVGTLAETTSAASHRLSASFRNACTGDGQDVGVSDLRVNVITVP